MSATEGAWSQVASPTRRQLLGRILGLGAAGLLSGCRPAAEEPSDSKSNSEDTMKLSLSARVAESFSSKERADLTLDQIIGLAQEHGYEAICMRASQVGTHSPPERVRAAARSIAQAGLTVSMVTGDFAVPRNDEQGPKGLRNITPYLDLTEALGSDLIRICMKKEEDIEWAARASDEARERGIRLAHQAHCASLFETVQGALDTLKRVGRSNFGIIYEPANWFIAGEDYGAETIRRLEPWIMNVYVQNHLLTPTGVTVVETWGRGGVAVDHIGLWEEGGVDFEEVFRGLDAIGYGGYVTVHQAFAGVMPVEEAAARSARYLKPLMGL
ncbi:MAG: sugar phosphate isomerase/epimerase [Acidobacteriota bacterium]|nr:sugar phosphate isomerase/epimerase [Acidobacteriota bacterium]